MTQYSRNKFVTETIEKCGETAGLPLFESAAPTMTERRLRRFESAARSMPVAHDTKRLARVKQKINSAELNKNQQTVYEAFRFLGPATNKEVSEYLKKKFNDTTIWDASTVNGRNWELRELNKLTAAGKRKCTVTGEVVTQWTIIQTEGEQHG